MDQVMSRWFRGVLAGSVVLLVGAAVVVVGARRGGTDPGTSDSDYWTGIAHERLPAAKSTPAIDRAGPVVEAYTETMPNFLGELTLWLSCAGAGRITLMVSTVPYGEAGNGPPIEEARASADCTPDAVPVRTSFVGHMGSKNFLIQLTDSGTAAGRAGFAYRVTSDTGKPILESDEMNPLTVLHLTSDAGLGMGVLLPADGERVGDRIPLHGHYKLAAACAGIGTLYVKIGKQKASVRCSWPPTRQDIKLARISEPQISYEFRSTSAFPADFYLQFVPVS
jgi:hypothetical protein